jgi:hypothetical protein
LVFLADLAPGHDFPSPSLLIITCWVIKSICWTQLSVPSSSAQPALPFRG